MKPLQIIPLPDIPIIQEKTDLVELILQKSLHKEIGGLKEGDILVISHTFLSKALGDFLSLENINPSAIAYKIAEGSELIGKLHHPLDPQHIQLILDKSSRILRAFPYLITETKHGFVSAHAGVDRSNVGKEKMFIALPEKPDAIAATLRAQIKEILGLDVTVILADSKGRPFRIGSVGIAVGISGINPLLDYRGEKDLYGRELQHKRVNIADEIVSAAQLVMGEADEGNPVVIIRNYVSEYSRKQDNLLENGTISSIVRPKESDLFRTIHPLDLLKSRYSYKKPFKEKQIPEEVIRKAIEIVRFSPSAHNGQPWQYYNVKKAELREKIVQEMGAKWKHDLDADDMDLVKIQSLISSSAKKFLNAPSFIVVSLDTRGLQHYNDKNRQEKEKILGIQSVSASIIYFCLALKYHGIETCWYSAGLFADDVIRTHLGLDSFNFPQAIILAGYGNHAIGESLLPEKSNRKNISDFYHVV